MRDSRPARRPVRLAVDSLEQRTVPANNLTITNSASPLNISVVNTGGVVTISTTGPDAQVNINTLVSTLMDDQVRQVVVTTAADTPVDDGQQPGNISWPDTTGDLRLPDLAGGKSLQFMTAAGTNAVGNVDLYSIFVDGPSGSDIWNNWLSVGFDTSAVNGAVTFHEDGTAATSFGLGIHDLTVKTGTGAFSDLDPSIAGSDNWLLAGQLSISAGAIDLEPSGPLSCNGLSLTGTSVTLSGAIDSGQFAGIPEADAGTVSVTGPITLAGDTAITSPGLIYLSGPIDGAHAMELSVPRRDVLGATASAAIVVGGNVGAASPLTALTIDDGNAVCYGTVLDAGQVTVGTGAAGNAASFGAAGTLTGNVEVKPASVLSPGGLNAVASLTVAGNVLFDAGSVYAPDLGTTSDDLQVNGNLTITGATLGGGYGSGALPGAPAGVVDYTGTLTGTFVNAPVGSDLITGTDAVQVTAYGLPGTGVVVAPLAAGSTPAVLTGTDADGTVFTARLSGGGQLVAGTDVNGKLFLVARAGTKPATLTVTARQVGTSDSLATFAGGIAVTGPLAAFSGPKVDVDSEFLISGPAKTISLDALLGGVLRAPDPETHLRLKARNVADQIATAGGVNSLAVSGVFTGSLTAQAVGPVRVRNMDGTIRSEGPVDMPSLVVTGEMSGSVVSLAGLTVFRSPTLGGEIDAQSIHSATVSLRLDGDFLANTVDAVTTKDGTQFSGVTAQELGTFRSTGSFVGGLTVRDANLVRLATGSASIAISTAGAVQMIKATGASLGLQVTGGRVQSIDAAGELSGLGPWSLTEGINSLKAANLSNLDVTAGWFGAITVTGSRVFHLPGNITQSRFHTTGIPGASAVTILASLTTTGDVSNTEIDADGGFVGPVKVGRFLDSRLYVDYTPGSSFSAGGTFWGGAGGAGLLSFTTTAAAGPSPIDGHYAFEESEIATPNVLTVRLSGVKTANGGTPFGIKFGPSPNVSVETRSADDPSVPLNTPITPSRAAVAGDFYVMQV